MDVQRVSIQSYINPCEEAFKIYLKQNYQDGLSIKLLCYFYLFIIQNDENTFH